MNTLLSYMVRSSLYLLVFYLVYWLLLSRDTAYGRNRIYLLLSVAASFILPLIILPGMQQIGRDIFGGWLPEAVIRADSSGKTEGVSTIRLLLPGIINIIYVAGLLVSLLKFFADLGNLVYLIINNDDNSSKTIKYHSFKTAGFSALGYIFLSEELSETDAEEIRKHEINHLRKYHFLDIVLVELAISFQWFNPAIHLLNRSLRAVHEYQADNECLRTGITLTGYQKLLLRQVFMSGRVKLSNSFSNPSLTRKRMIMMTRQKSSVLTNLKILAAIPVILITFLAVSASGTIRNNGATDGSALNSARASENEAGADEAPYVVVEEMPLFPGGDQALLTYIASHTVYPEAAKQNNIQGRVIVRFCVTSKGNVEKVSILDGVDPVLDNEAIRVTQSLPAFKPGRQGGKPVPVWYMIPVTFTLR